ncbi:MAG: WD40 repeat domain-containing protein, partial [Pseudomonadota bacterium]
MTQRRSSDHVDSDRSTDPSEAQLNIEFDLFISYSTNPDYRLARALHRFLSTFHDLRPVRHHGLPPLNVCLDGGSFVSRKGGRKLSVQEIVEDNLGRSRQLLVLCSSGASSSGYVAHEVRWFLEHRGAANIMLAVTEGNNPSETPDAIFPAEILETGLQKGIWFDLRSLRRGARQWDKVRDANRERVRLVAELVAAAGGPPGLTAERLFPDWREHEQRRTRRRRNQWLTVGAAFAVISILATGALQRSRLQGELATLRDLAEQSTRIAVNEPEQALRNAAGAWRAVEEVDPWAVVLPGLKEQARQTRSQALGAVFQTFSGRPGYAGVLTAPFADAHIQSNPTGRRLAVAGTRSGANTVELWVAEGSTVRRTAGLAWPERVQCLALSPDGRRMLVAGRRYIGLWSVGADGAGREVRTIDLAAGEYPDVSCSSAALAPDGEYAALGSNEGALIRIDWVQARIQSMDVPGVGGIVNDLAFANDGQSIYVAVWRSAPALLHLRLDSGRIAVTAFGTEDAPRSISLSADGDVLFSGHERGFVAAHSTTDYQRLWVERLSTESIVDLAAAGRSLIVGNEGGLVRFVDLPGIEGGLPAVRMARTTITGLALFPSADSVAIAGANDPIRLWRSDFAHPMETLIGRNSLGGLGLELSETEERVTAFGENEYFAWTSVGDTWRPAPVQSLGLPSGWQILASTRDGMLFAVSAVYAERNPDNRVRLIRPGSDPIELRGFDAKLVRTAFSPSGHQLAVASFDRPMKIAIWDTARPTDPPRVLEPQGRVGATGIVFSNDGSQLAISSLRGCIDVWQLEEPTAALSYCDADVTGELAFDPSGRMLAAGSLTGRIHIVRVSPGSLTEERTIDGHRESTTALAFDRSGEWLISASGDGELRFWETTGWRPVGVSQDPDNSFVRQIVAGPGNHRVATLTQGGRPHLGLLQVVPA